MKKLFFILCIIFINYNLDAQVGSVQFSGAPSSDLFIDAEPGTRILRTRNWNTSAPNIQVTGIHTGTGQFDGNLNVAGTINSASTINANALTASFIRTTTWQPYGSIDNDFFLDIEPGSRILRTRNWNTITPNIAATGIHTGKGIFETDLSVGNNLLLNGKLGIGINIPTRQLDIIGSPVNGNYTSLIRVGTHGPAYGNSGGGIEFAAFNNNGQINSVGVIAACLIDGTANHQTGDLRFLVSNSGSLQEKMRLNSSGNLDVNGTIHAREVKVDLNFPADYVFKPDYKLMTLAEVEQFIKVNSHLPEIPSAAEIKENGLNVGEMQNKLLQKIEEMTLYMIEQNKKIEQQNEKIIELEKQNLKIHSLEKEIEKLKAASK